MLPPELKQEWDKNTDWQKALLFAYEQIREYEDLEIATTTGMANVF